LNYFWIIFELYVNYLWIIFWIIFELSLNYYWNIFELFLNYFYLLLNYLWIIFELFLNCFGLIFGLFLIKIIEKVTKNLNFIFSRNSVNFDFLLIFRFSRIFFFNFWGYAILQLWSYTSCGQKAATPSI